MTIPRYTMLGTTAPVGADLNSGDSNTVTVGVRFDVGSSDRWITKIRFYKGNTASDVYFQAGIFLDGSPTLLASGDITVDYSTIGWVDITLTTPYQVLAGNTYIAAVYMPYGHYSATTNGYSGTFGYTPIVVDGITIWESASGYGPTGQGLYKYNAGLILPDSSYNSTNYWVDIEFTTTAP